MKQDAFANLVEVVVPQLGAGGAEIRFVTWLVPDGSQVIEGERIAELLTQGILFHLDSPAAGTLAELRTVPGNLVNEGDLLARIRPEV